MCSTCPSDPVIDATTSQLQCYNATTGHSINSANQKFSSTSWASLVGKAFWKSQMFYLWNTVAADLQREQLQISQFQARDFAKSLSAPSAFSSLCIPSHLSNGSGGIFLYGLKYFKSLKLFKLALILKRQLTHDKRRGGFWQLTTASHLLLQTYKCYGTTILHT